MTLSKKQKAVVDFDSEKRMSAVEESEALAILIQYMLERDPQHKGLRARDIVAALYPVTKDGYDSVRRVIEQIARTFPGRVPETVRLGKFFSRMDGVTVVGGSKLRRTSLDNVGTAVWTAVLDSDATPPLDNVAKGPSIDHPKRPYVDDTPTCRQLIEKDVGEWLCQNASSFTAPPPAAIEAVSGTGAVAAPRDLVLRSGCWVCVVYTKDCVAIGNRLRIDVAVWNALGEARKNGATVFLSFCDDNVGILSFDSYDRLAWAPEETRSVEGNWLSFTRELLTSVGWFKAVIPHIQMLRGRTDASLGVAPVHALSKFDAAMLRNDPELASAGKRGWLLSRTRPEDGTVSIWSRRCEIMRSIDLYACVYSTARGVVPGALRGHVRLDLFCANLGFTQAQLDHVLEQLAPHLSPTEHQAIQPTPVFLAITCDGRAAETIGTILYEAATSLRPKRLRPGLAAARAT